MTQSGLVWMIACLVSSRDVGHGAVEQVGRMKRDPVRQASHRVVRIVKPVRILPPPLDHVHHIHRLELLLEQIKDAQVEEGRLE